MSEDSRKIWRIAINTVKYNKEVPDDVPVVDFVKTDIVENLINKKMKEQNSKETIKFKVL